MAAHTSGDWVRAENFLTEALAFYENGTLSNVEERVQILLALGNIQARLHNSERARQYTEQALATAREAGDTRREARALHLLGNIALDAGDLAESRDLG